MILTENRNVLRFKNRELLTRLTKIENNDLTGSIVVESAKTGIPTMKVNVHGRMQYVHSKYDPEKEAERFINQFQNDAVKHVLFVGMGLGYHIQNFIKKNPNTKFSIYEPSEEALVVCLSNKNLSELLSTNLIRIFTSTEQASIELQLHHVLQSANGVLQVITLPVYERIYGKQIDAIMKHVIKTLKIKRSNLVTNLSHQKRWVVNSIKNFPTLLETPNILHDIDRSYFKDKPAIIVAAGPSLNMEFENLRYIKENNLAYIFSVGSAINSLIENEIFPDATCSFDPKSQNYKVIQKIRDRNIKSIPLIFGSSVGFETLEDYPGKMLHVITSPDTVSPQLLDTSKSIDVVWDAPTISALTLQILSNLKSNPIILVGQNLAFHENVRYADGIKYDFVESKLSEAEQNKTISIKDVHGNEIQTNDIFISMKRQLELYIKSFKPIEVINTTKGGAHIEGTTFIALEEVIEKRLQLRINKYDWNIETSTYDIQFIKERLKLLIKAKNNFKYMIENIESILKTIDSLQNKVNWINTEKSFEDLDKQFTKLKENPFYKGFVEPMLKVQNENLSEKSQFIRYEKDLIKKANVIVESFTLFINEVQKSYKYILPYFEELTREI